MPANRRFLCGGVPYTTFLCYRGWCTLTLLTFQVWTRIFSLSKKRQIGIYLPSSYLWYLFCNSAVAASRYLVSAAATARSVAVTNTIRFFEIRFGLPLGQVQGRKLERFTKSSKQWLGGILHSIRNWAQGLYFPEFRQRINTSKWIISMIKEKLRAG